MHLSDCLELLIKPDLNLIYTERPFEVSGKLDFGWFCREHALHLHLPARCLGRTTRILVGEVTVLGEDDFVSTLNTDSDHAWCSIDFIAPVDLSLCLKHLSEHPDIALVYGQGPLFTAPYVVFSEGSRVPPKLDLTATPKPAIVYHEVTEYNGSPLELVYEPYSFLHSPPPGVESLADTCGIDIFDKITMHCLDLCLGKAEPWWRSRTARQVMQDLKETPSDARTRLVSHLLSNESM